MQDTFSVSVLETPRHLHQIVELQYIIDGLGPSQQVTEVLLRECLLDKVGFAIPGAKLENRGDVGMTKPSRPFGGLQETMANGLIGGDTKLDLYPSAIEGIPSSIDDGERIGPEPLLDFESADSLHLIHGTSARPSAQPEP